MARPSPLALVFALSVPFAVLTFRAASAPRRERITRPAAHVARDEAPSPQVSAAPSASLSASAAPSGSAPAPKPTLAASFVSEPAGSERSALPTLAEWKAAPALDPGRGGHDCEARRVREWVKLSCQRWNVQAVALVAGSAEGVHVGLGRKDWWGETNETIIMAVRPGDRRIFTVTGSDFSRYGPGGPVTEMLIEERWLDDEPTPSVLFR